MIMLLERLEKLERRFGMLGTIIGITIILACFIATILTIKFLLELNFNVLQWVCKTFWGFKLY